MIRRPVLALIGVVTLAVLTGCVTTDPPAPTVSEVPVTASPSPTEEAITDLTFAAGEDLPTTAVVEWADPLADGDGYTLSRPDDGGGSWAYTDSVTECYVSFYQGTVDGIDYSASDEAASEAVLMARSGVDEANAEEWVDTSSLRLLPSGGTVEVQRFYASAPQGSMVIAARAFGSLGVGMTVKDMCPADVDAWEHFLTLDESGLGIMISEPE